MTESAAPASDASIDRHALVARHQIEITEPHPEHVLSVGNGDFAFGVDITGMQTFTAFHTVSGDLRGMRSAINTTTMSNWGWHEMPNPEGWVLEDAMSTYETARGPVSYPDRHDMMAGITGVIPDEFRPGWWLHANPQRADLGRIGLELRPEPDAPPETDPGVLTGTRQRLDLWTGTIASEFSYAGEDVHVDTVASPTDSVVGFRLASPLLADGRARVVFRFPYPSDGFLQTDDWDAADRHTSTLDPDGHLIHRDVDDLHYLVRVAATTGRLTRTGTHEFTLTGPEPTVELVVRFAAAGEGELAALPSFAEVAAASARGWRDFWESGAAIDFSASTDPRAAELERRVILSQYLSRALGAGSLPPAETGLVTNSWQGKFHLEMHYWHSAHLAVWGRPQLLERSMRWYLTIADAARATAARQGYPGLRWPKHTAPDGRESPSHIGALLIWQQPHFVHLLELIWQASTPQAREELLARYGQAVEETAEFMAAFAEERDGTFHLGPPVMPAQEFYDARTTTDPTFELAYWWWGLHLAQTWRQRRGLTRRTDWQDVQDRLAAPGVLDGRYTAILTDEPLRRDDHPSFLMALGVVPPTPLIDPAIMLPTLRDVWQDWEWPTAWGWDFPVLAMTATRLGQPGLAVDALLREEPKNHYTLVGHNRQTPGMLPLYLPGNGGLLLAVALMAQSGGFNLDGWSIRAEGFSSFPDGRAYDQNRPPQVIERTQREDDTDMSNKPLTAQSSIGEWLENPVGGELLRGLLAQAGGTADSLAPIKGLPLRQMVALSQGQMPQEVIDALVLQANDGVMPDNGEDTTWQEATTPGRFAGKTVIVTGAASGIGRATASRIAREGGRVVAVDVSTERLAEFAASLPDAQILTVTADITNQEAVETIVTAAGERIDGLANIAGINDDFSPLAETTDATWDRVIGVNLTGTFKLSRAVIPVMLAAGKGAIVNTASEAGLRGNASGNAYTVSKHGVIGLTKSAAFMYGPDGIRVNAVAPGGVATGIPFPPHVSEAGRDRLQPFQAQIPTVATAEQLAASITFLLSDDGVNINGAVLASDGGWSVQ